MISVVVLTHNEEVNLPRCLASAGFSEDVLVLDSGSSDRTVEVARAAGARVLMRSFDSFASQRNFAMEQGALRFPWVLHLDADEVVTPELRAELVTIAGAGTTVFPVYKVPSRLMFMGHWLRHAGMYPAYQVRFGRADALRFIDHGHGQREVQASSEVGTLKAPLDHFNFSKGVNDWFRRHLGYARREAIEALNRRNESIPFGHFFSSDVTTRRRALKILATRLPARPFLRFVYSYLVRAGFLDGRAGFHYSKMLAVYQYMIDLNIRELAENASTESVTGRQR
jgi:glycosyltransferase involved in cell wall biosynthesis